MEVDFQEGILILKPELGLEEYGLKQYLDKFIENNSL